MRRKLKNEELKRLSEEEFRKAEKCNVVLVLDNVRSLHNVGSVFRTADAFRVNEIWLCGFTGTPPDREIEKTALGATKTVQWRHEKEISGAITFLKASGYSVYAIEQTTGSTMLNEFTAPDNPFALIFGNEVYGVSQAVIDQCDGVIEIPQSGTKHSLNISVSVGIVLWELFRETRLSLSEKNPI